PHQRARAIPSLNFCQRPEGGFAFRAAIPAICALAIVGGPDISTGQSVDMKIGGWGAIDRKAM
ncbi:hypothetical protein A4X13_0g9654, partial [Tilletia indica]